MWITRPAEGDSRPRRMRCAQARLTGDSERAEREPLQGMRRLDVAREVRRLLAADTRGGAR